MVSGYHLVFMAKKNYAILTDIALKILKIEISIASELNSQYKSMNLLCKSHS